MLFTEFVLRIFMIDHSKTFVMHIYVYIYIPLQRRRRRKKMNWLCQFYFMIFFLYSNKNKSLASIKLFNSENSIDVQSYDCIYYTNIKAENNETTPYCIRKKENILLNRSFTKAQTCQNSGQEWDFKILKTMNITQDEILKWNSSIEMADRYAAYLTNQNEELSNEKICNCSANTPIGVEVMSVEPTLSTDSVSFITGTGARSGRSFVLVFIDYNQIEMIK